MLTNWYSFQSEQKPLTQSSNLSLFDQSWPIQTEDEYKALSSIGALYGAHLKLEKNRRSLLKRHNAYVGYINDEDEVEAALYAELTGRTTRRLKSVSEIESCKEISVFLCSIEKVDAELLKTIWRRSSSGSTCGIVTAERPKLRIQVLCKSAARFLSIRMLSSPTLAWLDLLPTLNLDKAENATRLIIGKQCNAAALKNALASNPALVRSVTTSDGVDAPIGSNLILCSIIGFGKHASSSKTPRCVDTGFCHRSNSMITNDLINERLIHADTIKAKVVIWQTCFGIMTKSRTLDDDWGVGRQLNESSNVGALITTCEYVLTNIEATEELGHDILNGKNLSRCIANYSSTDKKSVAPHPLYLFGDPDCTLGCKPIDAPRLISEKDKRRQPIEQATDFLSFTPEQTLLMKAIQSSSPSAHLNLVTMASHRSQAKQNIAINENNQKKIDEKFLSHIIARRWARWIDDWLKHSSIMEVNDPGSVCPCCSKPMVSRIVKPDVLGTALRRCSICRTCGPVEDVPASCDIVFRIIDNDKCQLDGQLPCKNWIAYRVIFSDREDETVIEKWPEMPDGSMQRVFLFPKFNLQGPLRFMFVMINDSWHMLTHPHRPLSHT